jgi:hypothetical protein
LKNDSVAHREFLENCQGILAKQSHVTINEQALEAFAKTLKASSFVPDWKEYISAEANSADAYDFKRAFYEFAMIIAQQGGFIYTDETGAAQKWHKDGSGAKAMVAKMTEIREAKAIPFYDIAAEDVDQKISPLLTGMPFAENRLKIFKECASAENHQKVESLLDSAFDGKAYKLDMDFVTKLAAALPEGLGGDPFMKKAILTCLTASANAHHHGLKVDISDLTVATDYILPQVLNADHIGVLSFSPALETALKNRQSLHEDSGEVCALRAAAVVACERLVELSGLSAQDVDSHLWLAGRKIQNARPHMMCYTMRF